MADDSVARALRSNAPLVVIEAPAGCGKTHQGGGYVRDATPEITPGRILVLTHTHAACDVFASRTKGLGWRIDIRTIDSLVHTIGAAYYLSLGISADPAAWARSRGESGYRELAELVAHLLRSAPFIGAALVQRYPIVVCDEHQDSNVDQHDIILSLHKAGARVRVFADPMQRIYDARDGDAQDRITLWEELKRKADVVDCLTTHHRWLPDAADLGEWIYKAREALKRGEQLDLRTRLPRGLRVLYAENQSLRFGGYQLTSAEHKPITDLLRSEEPLLVLTSRNRTARSLRSFFHRQIPLWEGHTRDALSDLVGFLQSSKGNHAAVAGAAIDFIRKVAVGFSSANFSSALLSEVSEGCSSTRRGRRAKLQQLARIILDQPDHRGVSNLLEQLLSMISTDAQFSSIKVDSWQEYRDAIYLGEFNDPEDGLTEISRRRAYSRREPSSQAISTIHKAKGLQRSHVLILPCDGTHFDGTDASRCLLYVAISRATKSLTLVVSRKNPSPLTIV